MDTASLFLSIGHNLLEPVIPQLQTHTLLENQMFDGWLPSKVVGRVDRLTMHKAIFTRASLVWRGQQLGEVIMEPILNSETYD